MAKKAGRRSKRRMRRRKQRKTRSHRGGNYDIYTIDTIRGTPVASTTVAVSPTATQSIENYMAELEQYQSSGYPSDE
jgi:hypothetical protein